MNKYTIHFPLSFILLFPQFLRLGVLLCSADFAWSLSCTNGNGLQKNINSCICGARECTKKVGLFCAASRSLCSPGWLPAQPKSFDLRYVGSTLLSTVDGPPNWSSVCTSCEYPGTKKKTSTGLSLAGCQDSCDEDSRCVGVNFSEMNECYHIMELASPLVQKIVYLNDDGLNSVAQTWQATIDVKPNVVYSVVWEVLRSDLSSSSEYVVDVKLDGKSFGGCNPPGTDYSCDFFTCYDGTLQNLGGSGCTSSSPCTSCEGDCDTDNDCAGALKCFQRDASSSLVPGCQAGGTGDVSSYDYCYSTDSGISSASGIINVAATFTGHSKDCDCDRSDPDGSCAQENTVSGYTPTKAALKFTLSPSMITETRKYDSYGPSKNNKAKISLWKSKTKEVQHILPPNTFTTGPNDGTSTLSGDEKYREFGHGYGADARRSLSSIVEDDLTLWKEIYLSSRMGSTFSGTYGKTMALRIQTKMKSGEKQGYASCGFITRKSKNDGKGEFFLFGERFGDEKNELDFLNIDVTMRLTASGIVDCWIGHHIDDGVPLHPPSKSMTMLTAEQQLGSDLHWVGVHKGASWAQKGGKAEKFTVRVHYYPIFLAATPLAVQTNLTQQGIGLFPQEFRVYAHNEFGMSATHLVSALSAPDPPLLLDVRVISDKSFQFKFQRPDFDGGSQITGYKVIQYILQETPKTWDASEASCVQLGTSCHLASISNEAENQVVKQLAYASENKKRYHIRPLVANEGNHLTQLSGAHTIEECESKCDATTNCKSFARCPNGAGNGCFMKDKVITATDTTSTNSDSLNNRQCKTHYRKELGNLWIGLKKTVVEVCYKIATGSAGSNDGYVTVLLNRGSGFQIEIASTMYSMGSTVFEKCFSDGTDLAIENTNTNAWAGTITANGDPMGCINCDLGTSTSNIVVDGNTDGASQAPNRCLSGKRCILSHDFGFWTNVDKMSMVDDNYWSPNGKKQGKCGQLFRGIFSVKRSSGGWCSDWTYADSGTRSGSYVTTWNTPQLCQDRCVTHFPASTAFYLVDGDKCGCSSTTTSGACALTQPTRTGYITYEIKPGNSMWAGTTCTDTKPSICKCSHNVIDTTTSGQIEGLIIAANAGSKPTTWHAQSCNQLACGALTNTNTLPPCSDGSIAKDGVCWILDCSAGQYRSGSKCRSMTIASCPEGKALKSKSAVTSTFVAVYEKISNTKCQANDGSDWDQWYKVSSFTASLCKQWCTNAGIGCVAWGIGLRSDLNSGCIIYMKNGIDPTNVSPVLGVTCAASCSGTAVDQVVVLKSSDTNWECNKKILHSILAATGSTEDDGLCENCLQGFFKLVKDSSLCMLCPRGYYSNSISAASCHVCAPGFYADTSGRLQCDSCSAGLYNDQSTQIAASACRSCEGGKFSPLHGSSFCEQCPAGTFLKDTTGAILLHDDRLDCLNCSTGLYNPFPGHSSECFDCLSAKFPGTTKCAGCAPGKFKVNLPSNGDNEDESRCDLCPQGYYTYDRDLFLCSKCPEGYHGFGNRPYTNCEACMRGKYGDVVAAISSELGCVDCSAGRFSEDYGLRIINIKVSLSSVPCKGCPKGRWSSVIGSEKESGCQMCGTGTHGSNAIGASSSSSCLECIVGRFSEAVGAFGMESCQYCPAGYVQSKEGQAFCLPCTPGGELKKSMFLYIIYK